MRKIYQLLFLLFLALSMAAGKALALTAADPFPAATSTRAEAIRYIDQITKLDSSKYWPYIKPDLFLKNLKLNVYEPLSFYPGRSTNFCAFGAASYIFIKEDPLGYVKFLMTLYNSGVATYGDVSFKPSDGIKNAAGRLRFKGVLDLRHAEQMWFLVLADRFKGYLNIFNRTYDRGDENRFWAATNYGKFNRMVKKLMGYRVHAVGSDLLHPWLKDVYSYIDENMKKGIVVLYINNRILHKKNHTSVKLGIPTHFIVLENISRIGNLITMQYWDYGSKTLMQVSPETLRKITYGISVCTKKPLHD
ncbi:MAG: hypothetical protein JWQ27_2064 [Ferruginibacter sp.]|nr:hypothetical protein [Ferruginibacter sp.]